MRLSLYRAIGCFVLLVIPFLLSAQLDYRKLAIEATPSHKSEVGLHAGYFFSSGDITAQPGFGTGIHFRRALDYMFSIRLEGMYGVLRGEKFSGQNQFTTEWFSASVHGMMSVNNLQWKDPKRRVNMYVFVGGGIEHFKADYNEDSGGSGSRDIVDPKSPMLEAGIGAAIRMNERMNIGIDYKASLIFGPSADQVDGLSSASFDVPNYISVRMNFNFGSKDKSEPLYWVNPLGSVLNDIRELQERPQFNPNDSDGDGVLDVLDLEPDSDPEAQVDTRGVTLDSDKDGIPNHLDKEPYSPPNFEYDSLGVALQPSYVTEESLEERLQQGRLEKQDMLPWFLPMVHFKTNQSEVRESEYQKIAHVARIMNLYEDIRLAVIGYTDQIGSEQVNNLLSYGRAEKTIDFLVKFHGINRNRFVLVWKGKEDALIVEKDDSYMNRRVEFEMAPPEMKDMSRPDKSGSGNKRRGF